VLREIGDAEKSGRSKLECKFNAFNNGKDANNTGASVTRILVGLAGRCEELLQRLRFSKREEQFFETRDLALAHF
jgi:hypothetical protein